MAATTSADSNIGTDNYSKRWWVVAPILISLAILYVQWRFPDFSISPKEKEKPSVVTQTRTIKVQIHPDQWSEWVRLPENIRFQINAPAGWHEYWFWDGRKEMVRDNEVSWLGNIPNNTFRLRGASGEVVIICEANN